MSDYIENMAINYIRQNPGILKSLLPQIIKELGPDIIPLVKDNPEIRTSVANIAMPIILSSSAFNAVNSAIPAKSQGFVFNNLKSFPDFVVADEGKALVGLLMEEWERWAARANLPAPQ